jgi:hypothetical protein
MLTKIDKDKVVLAWEAATHALLNDDAYAWIRSSVLFERAYFIGLMNGLSAIGDEEDINRLMTSTFFHNRLIWSRSGDDTFESTNIGQIFSELKKVFSELKKELYELDNSNSIDLKAFQRMIEEANRFISEIDHLDRGWLNCVQQTRKLLSEIKSTITNFQDSVEDNSQNITHIKEEFLRQAHEQISTLRDMARYISLVQTHHEMSKRL